MSGHRKSVIKRQFAWRYLDMLYSPAYRALSLSGHRVISRIELELGKHGGDAPKSGKRENGKLVVTFDDFEEYGIDRHSILGAIREVVALGFVAITEAGRAGNAEFRAPNKFRLTYRPTQGVDATEDWEKIGTLEEARTIAAQARKTLAAERRETRKATRRKSKIPVGVNTNSSGGGSHRNHSGNSPTTAIVENPPLLSIYREGSDDIHGVWEWDGAASRTRDPVGDALLADIAA